MDLCRGWSQEDVEKLYADATDGERTLLETMARSAMTTRSDLIASLGEGPDRAVDGYLGNLGKRAYKMDVKDAEGNVSWPFFINTDEKTNESVYLMPKAVAEIISPGARSKSEPWEL